MKKITKRMSISLLALLAVFLISASEPRLVRLTVINGSDLPIALQLIGQEEEEMYYLPVGEGSVSGPQEKVFTIIEDVYALQLYYVETWDPVYGFQCDTPAPSLLRATRNMRVVVKDCDRTPRFSKEVNLLKLPFSLPQFPGGFGDFGGFFGPSRGLGWRFTY